MYEYFKCSGFTGFNNEATELRSLVTGISEGGGGGARAQMWACSPAIITEIFRGFRQPLQANVGIVVCLKLGRDRFLPKRLRSN
jgi:hypothetical protein